MGQKQDRQPGDRTLEYGVDSLLTIRYTNIHMNDAAIKLYRHRNTNPEHFRKIILVLSANKTKDEKLMLLGQSKDYFLGFFTEKIEDTFEDFKVPVITPWEVELAKERADLIPLLGPVKDRLPIIVIFNYDGEHYHRYNYEWSEDFTFGILYTIDAYYHKNNIESKFKFNIEDDIFAYPVTIFDIAANYVSSSTNKRYVAVTFLGEATFNSTEVIQGIITAASWLNVDPHTYIKDITDNGVPTTF